MDNGLNPDPYLMVKNNSSDNGSNPDPNTQWKEKMCKRFESGSVTKVWSKMDNGSNPDPNL